MSGRFVPPNDVPRPLGSPASSLSPATHAPEKLPFDTAGAVLEQKLALRKRPRRAASMCFLGWRSGDEIRRLTLPFLDSAQAQVPGSFKANPIPTVNKKQAIPADFFQKCYMKGYLRTLPKKQRIWCMIHENNVCPHPVPSPLSTSTPWQRNQPPRLLLDSDSGHPPQCPALDLLPQQLPCLAKQAAGSVKLGLSEP